MPTSKSDDNADAERQRRLDALRGLAEHAAPVPFVTERVAAPDASQPPLEPLSRPRTGSAYNRWLALIAVALCVVVIAVVVLTRLAQPHARASTTRHEPTSPLLIRPANDQIGCPRDALWSPVTGAEIAMFGDNCGVGDTYLNLYDAVSGKLTAQTDLTSAITYALQTYAPNSFEHLAPILLQPALWTTQDLYIPFMVIDSAADTSADAVPAEGLIGISPSSGRLQPTIGIIPNHFGVNAYVRWDMFDFTASDSTAFPAALVDPAPGHPEYSSLPPSLAYQISDPPRPLTPVSYRTAPAAAAAGPIGDPAADNQISIWQPGTLTYLATIPGTATPASIVLFDTGFDVEGSPYLYTGIIFEGRLVPPDQPAPAVNALGAAGLLAPWLPIRDSALAYVVADVEHSAAETVGPAAIAWRPDGARLAYQPGIVAGGGGGPRAHDVRIYDCQTGQVLVTLTPPLYSGGSSTSTNLMRWSPDGTRLLLLDRVAGQIVVWGKEQLPA